MEKTTYNPVWQVKLSDNKFLVLSECSKGGYTLGQKIIAKDGENDIDIFLKGTVHIKDIDTLKEIYNKIGKIVEN